MSTQAFGKCGEKSAEMFLCEQGLLCLDRNWRYSNWGEIDLVMKDEHELVFVEVKTRAGGQVTAAIEAVDQFKLQRIQRLAQKWINTYRQVPAQTGDSASTFSTGEKDKFRRYRVDLVAVTVQTRPVISTNRKPAEAKILWLRGIDR